MDAGYDVYEYSRRGMLKELKEALSGGSGPDQYIAYDGSTPLAMAARSGHGHIVRELLLHAADTGARTEEGSTLLHHAVSGGSCEAVAALLEAGLDPNIANEDGVAPLTLAAHYQFLDIVRRLCEGGADMNAQADGWGTALDAARGDVEQYLLGRGAVRSAAGMDQPLAAAGERFHYGCFESGENPHATPTTAPQPAHAAAGGGGGGAVGSTARPRVGDCVRLRRPKTGVLKEGDVGTVVEDDGSDCIPLKVALDGAHDYYDLADLEVCGPAVELPPDSDRATPEGTRRFLQAKLGESGSISTLGQTGLSVSPVGFGCHRLEDSEGQRGALALALAAGCNLVDLAPNYVDGTSEKVAGEVIKELLDSRKLRRDELVVCTKVGNVLGRQVAHAAGVAQVARLSDDLSHCIAPAWIEQELTRSLERLQLDCVDCLLLHCPECESKAEGVDMAEVYARMKAAFAHLETEVARGRVAMYGVSAAFLPLRPTDAEHLDLQEVLKQLPDNHHFRVIQTPLNFAEAENLWVGHTPRRPDGTAINKDLVLEAPTFFELARAHGLATLINRPLDGIYKESHGILRFSSLDCDARSFSELQLDNCDVLETKITAACKLDQAPFNAGAGAAGQLAAKTVKVLCGLQDVDCVLLGMRQVEYVVGTLPLALSTPPVAAAAAAATVREMHRTVCMWYATAIHEADHGTSKTWRLDVSAKYVEDPANGPALGA